LFIILIKSVPAQVLTVVISVIATYFEKHIFAGYHSRQINTSN